VCLLEIKAFTGKKTLFKYAVVMKYVALRVYCLQMRIIETVSCTVGDVDSGKRFCVRTIQTVDVRLP
jgi:hypothetical protein